MTEPREREENLENDHELKVRLALKMAGVLPDDPKDGAEVLALTASLYAVLTESRSKQT